MATSGSASASSRDVLVGFKCMRAAESRVGLADADRVHQLLDVVIREESSYECGTVTVWTRLATAVFLQNDRLLGTAR